MAGACSTIPLKAARIARDDVNTKLAEGLDPSAVRKQEREQRAAIEERTFAALVDDYLDKKERDGIKQSGSGMVLPEFWSPSRSVSTLLSLCGWMAILIAQPVAVGSTMRGPRKHCNGASVFGDHFLGDVLCTTYSSNRAPAFSRSS